MRSPRIVAPLFFIGTIVAACSSGAGTGGATPVPSAQPSPSAPSPSTAATGTAINLADSSLGKILVGGTGLTLYAFTPDSADKSACTGDCATNWPPLTSDAAPALGTGLDAEDFKTITRDDGSSQVTFYGLPLYYFSGDTGPGDTNGQGIGGKWYVVDGEGKMIGATAGGPSPSTAATGTAINLADSSLGKILVDGTGLTLYAFTPDSADKSACTGDCATNWPPLTSDGAPTLGTGLDAEDFKTIKRDDGSTQVTFYGRPLYHFAGDTGPGDTNGQGLGGKWYVVDGEGKLIK